MRWRGGHNYRKQLRKRAADRKHGFESDADGDSTSTELLGIGLDPGSQVRPQLLIRSGTILNMTRLAGMTRPPHSAERRGYLA